jgi:chemotaxis protein methyltransferase CheR
MCRAQGFATLEEYFASALADPGSTGIERIIDRLTTNHTYFMRESEHFSFLMSSVLPWAVEEAGERRDLRLWCAGCSSGEEAYTIAICAMEFLKACALPGWDSVVLASDLSRGALSAAAFGKYPRHGMDELPPQWIADYFEPQPDGDYRVSSGLRKNVAFKRQNLVEPFDFSAPFHAIFCRNVMIYFDNETKVDVLKRFYEALLPGGYLFVGHSESLAQLNEDLTYVRPSVYRKPL